MPRSTAIPAVSLSLLLLAMGCGRGSERREAGADAGATREAAALDEYLDGRARGGDFSGAVLVSRGSDLLLRKGYGMADHELGVPLEAEHVLLIGSLTKPVTAAAALRLVDRGSLTLDDSVCGYLPNCPEDWRGVTVEHLLSHTSGVPDLFEEVECAPVEDTGAEIEKTLAASDVTLESAPGESYDYNNFGYVLLGYVMELAVGAPWEEILREEIFRPLGMRQTRYDDVWAIVEGRARGYELIADELANIEYDDHCAYAAGGLRSTVDDLDTFVRGVHGESLLPEALRSSAFEPPEGRFYGYGWAVERFFGRRVHDHTGGIGGFSSAFTFYPEEDLSIVVLSNVQEENAIRTACDLAALLFEEDWRPLGAFEPLELGKEERVEYTGTYEDEGGSSFVISEGGNRLRLARNGGRPRDLLPVENDLFALAGAEHHRVRFGRDAGRRAESLALLRCGEIEARGRISQRG
jgi:CubicO group peptidase (beta-lactamase class C family)